MMLFAGLLLAAAIDAAPASPALPGAKAAVSAPFIPAAVDASELDGLRGGAQGASTIITDQVLKAVNSGNTINGEAVSSGAISIGGDAFSGFSGVGNFAINTGHNNNLQSSVSVSVIVAPPMGQ